MVNQSMAVLAVFTNQLEMNDALYIPKTFMTNSIL